jgi:hypothetical protein
VGQAPGEDHEETSGRMRPEGADDDAVDDDEDVYVNNIKQHKI